MIYLSPYIQDIYHGSLRHCRRNIETNEVFAYIRYNTLVKAYYGYVPSITKNQVATKIQDLETAMLDVDYFIKINLADECEFLTDEQYKRIELLV